MITKSKVTIVFITHQLPKGLKVDEAVILGKKNNVVEYADDELLNKK